LPAVLAVVTIAGCTVASDLGDAAGGADPRSDATASPRGSSAPAAPGDDRQELKRFYTQSLTWKSCDTETEQQKDQARAFRCATLTVPLDYAEPGGRTIDIAVTRKTAGKSSARRGSLLINPGGPGGSGVEAAWWMSEDTIGEPVRDAYDLVGFDPRGVDRSAPVKCLTDTERDEYVGEDLPEDDALARTESEQRDKEYAGKCETRSGDLLPHVGTENAARDMDVLRAVLGEDKLDYLGFSYGTYLGSVYAERFPERTGRLVLDGAVDPEADNLTAAVEQQIGFDKSLHRFAQDCAKRAACPLGSDPASAATKAADFLDGLQERPLRSSEGRELTSRLAWTGVTQLLYGDEEMWEYLREGLTSAMVNGSPDLLLYFADSYNGRDESGRYDNMMDAFEAISCADTPDDPPTPQEIQAALTRLKTEAPLASRDVTAEDLSGERCENWPFHATEKPAAITAEGSAPILVVGTTGDPATPYASAEKLAGQLSDATLLTFEGEGHTAYGGNSTCVDDAVEAFLLDGTMPADGTRCT